VNITQLLYKYAYRLTNIVHWQTEGNSTNDNPINTEIYPVCIQHITWFLKKCTIYILLSFNAIIVKLKLILF